MKRFLLLAPGMSATEQEIWRHTGFDCVTAIADNIDVVWIDRFCSSRSGAEEQVLGVLPDPLGSKVFMVKKQADTSFALPEDCRPVYSWKEYAAGPSSWILGSKLETPLSEDMGALLSEQATAAFAESLYYYLLRDVFRETAEWCGHMSSVVGRM